jgi:hypothetical protein
MATIVATSIKLESLEYPANIADAYACMQAYHPDPCHTVIHFKRHKPVHIVC